MFTVKRVVEIAASHQLLGMPDGHKCKRLHGHNYTIEITLKSAFLDDTGMVLDYGVISDYVKENYDHQHLNQFFEPATAENFCRVLWDGLEQHVLGPLNADTAQAKKVMLVSVTVNETNKSVATLTR